MFYVCSFRSDVDYSSNECFKSICWIVKSWVLFSGIKIYQCNSNIFIIRAIWKTTFPNQSLKWVKGRHFCDVSCQYYLPDYTLRSKHVSLDLKRYLSSHPPYRFLALFLLLITTKNWGADKEYRRCCPQT